MLGFLAAEIYRDLMFPHLDAYDLIMWKRTNKLAYKTVEATKLAKEKIYYRVVLRSTGKGIRECIPGMTDTPSEDVPTYQETILSALRKQMFALYKFDIKWNDTAYWFQGDGLAMTYHEPYLFQRTDAYHEEKYYEKLLNLEQSYPEIFRVYKFYFPRGKHVCLFDETHTNNICCEGEMHRGVVTVLRIFLPDNMMMYEKFPDLACPMVKKRLKSIEEEEVNKMPRKLMEWIQTKVHK